MRQLVLGMALIVIIFPHAISTAGEVAARLQVATNDASIEYPVEGQVLQGNVAIIGRTGRVEIQSYVVDFAYSANPSSTWFLIHEGTNQVENDVLATWNTTNIADGEYSLRLSVKLTDGTLQVVVVNGLRVRNNASIEAASTSPTAEGLSTGRGEPATSFSDGVIPMTPLASHLNTPTPLPANPIEINYSQVYATLGKGAVISLSSFAGLGIYLGLRRRSKKRK